MLTKLCCAGVPESADVACSLILSVPCAYRLLQPGAFHMSHHAAYDLTWVSLGLGCWVCLVFYVMQPHDILKRVAVLSMVAMCVQLAAND
jgi:hypothetical protein